MQEKAGNPLFLFSLLFGLFHLSIKNIFHTMCLDVSASGSELVTS